MPQRPLSLGDLLRVATVTVKGEFELDCTFESVQECLRHTKECSEAPDHV